ncbi:MAG: hypothetical protein RL660_644 [Bacteroidota bacterium]|jgi:hypothetical protein
MEFLAEQIKNIISDYQNDHGVFINTRDILAWVNQFQETDRTFILEEFLHLLNQNIYLSKAKAKKYLFNNLHELAKYFKYDRISSFLANTHFLDLQKPGKSQSQILKLMDEVLQENYSFSIERCGSGNIKHFIYLDDVLATGNTLCRDLETWLSTTNIKGKNAIQLFKDKQIDLIASFFCYHTWGWGNVQYILAKKLDSERFLKGIVLQYEYEIQNNIKFKNQTLNCLIPLEINESAKLYLNKLSQDSNSDRAIRSSSNPAKESFFSSAENRIRFETIMLEEGIRIVNKIQNARVLNIRPLGYTVKSHQTFGLGTMYFTWRNISNTCPLVFWWDNHGWKGLFPLQNRG